MNEKTAIILVNLGSPDSYKPTDIKAFLKCFLSDQRVVTLPKYLWYPILHTILLNIRPKKLTHAYKKIWIKGGSPLIVKSQNLAKKLKKNLSDKNIFIEYASCYSNPNIMQTYQKLLKKQVDKIILIPLYPQYSSTTTGPVMHSLARAVHPCQGGCAFKCKNPNGCLQYLNANLPNVITINSYFDNPHYINAITKSILQYWQKKSKPDVLLFSFHGLPATSIQRGDPYHKQCLTTVELITKKLKLKSSQYRVSFQSRFGYAKWLQPYTIDVLHQLAKENKSVHVVCPGFAVDCLETLEEIAIMLKEEYIKSGGKKFCYIPSLNDSQLAVEVIEGIIKQTLY